MFRMGNSNRPELRSIVVFRALQLGDMLNAVPALRALRAAHPDAQISLVGLPWAEEFVERFHAYVDDFISFPGWPGMPEQTPNTGHIPSFIAWVQAQGFDLAIQMHGSGEFSNPLIALWGAKRCAGFYRKGGFAPDPDLFLPYPEHEPEVWRHLRLMEMLNVPLKGDALEFPLFQPDYEEFWNLRSAYSLEENYICLHPGARRRERRWPADQFAALADGLSMKGYQIVLTGSFDEAGLTAQVASQMKSPVIDLGGRTTLGGLAVLLSNCRLLVSNDTGVSHLAAALKTPSVVLFSVLDHDRWAPQDRRLHKTLQHSMNWTADEVLLQAERHLKEVHSHAQ
jgi:ADP-heptose:LPS heptosyltransferase